MEDEARERQQELLDGSASPRGDAPGARADAVRDRGRGGRRAGPPRRGGHVTEFDGNLGLVIGAGGGSLTLFDAVRAHGGRPANYCEIGGNPSVEKAWGLRSSSPEARRREDRGDDVDRLEHARRHRRPRRDQGLPRARLRPGGEDRDLPIPGAWEDEGFKILGHYGVDTRTAQFRCTRRRGRAGAG